MLEKEMYFTPQNIADTATQFFSEVKELTKNEFIPFQKKKSALLLIDMQGCFFDPSSPAFVPSSTAILPMVIRLAMAFNQAALPVYLTRHVNSEANAGSMARWWGALIRENEPASQLIEPMNRIRAKVFKKSQYDAFHRTRLKRELVARNVRQLVIAGVLTHLCCETTARSAFVHGFDVFFTVDGTATYNRGFHRASLRNLAHGFAVPVTVADILAKIR